MRDFIKWFFGKSQLAIAFKYAKYVVLHKLYVGIFLWKEGYYWQAITHDISKFRWFPFWAYANYFYGEREPEGNSETGFSKPIVTCDKDFDYAWLLHQKRNPHHWQFWILLEDSGNIKFIDIPKKYLMEMVCDWYGASIATGRSDFSNYRTNTKKWYLAHRDIIQVSEKTRKLLDWELDVWMHDLIDHELEMGKDLKIDY